ncbi:putative bifunctional diguanylate cyclase/phosphodiesterase [Acidocella facilis]|uniref:putative bifunctional diguanylate cyclase/phosphodiesterase n=1 Tax=Acidocella facilis TaxID=525 RepID=UPI001FD137AD|nr:EAL domain-containing protein [Acidocella facilis]
MSLDPNTSIGFHDPKLVIPASAAEIGAWSNTLIAMGELVFIVVIMNADLSVRRTMDVEMRKAIANGDFQLHYQPQINEAGRVVSAEALIRWRHAKMGNVPPVKFIPLAEETGLIVPIGNWVLRAACAQLAQWEAQQHTQHLTMAVNVSASQFRQPDFVQTVSEIIRLSGVTPSKLKLELTESMFIDNVDATVAKMIALKAIGISWSLDDFGTGYSSLSVLNRFPLGQIKIDKSFVRDMLTNARNMVVTQAIIELAGKLNLQVIAEGVETREQLNRLREVGCLNYQGYFFSPPLDIDAFGTFLLPAPSKSKTFS